MYIPRSEIADLQGIYSAFVEVANFPRPSFYQSTPSPAMVPYIIVTLDIDIQLTPHH